MLLQFFVVTTKRGVDIGVRGECRHSRLSAWDASVGEHKQRAARREMSSTVEHVTAAGLVSSAIWRSEHWAYHHKTRESLSTVRLELLICQCRVYCLDRSATTPPVEVQMTIASDNNKNKNKNKQNTTFNQELIWKKEEFSYLVS